MSIQKVSEVLTPPLQIVEAIDDIRWAEFEKELGLALPADYKEFVKVYGTGYVGNFISIWNPICHDENHNLVSRSKAELLYLHTFKANTSIEMSPFPVFPEINGIFPFAHTLNGDIFYWQTIGNPDTWPLLIHQVRSSDYELHDMMLTEFLVQLLTGQLVKTFIYQTFFDPKKGFTSLA